MLKENRMLFKELVYNFIYKPCYNDVKNFLLKLKYRYIHNGPTIFNSFHTTSTHCHAATASLYLNFNAVRQYY